MRTRTWSELIVNQEVKLNGNESYLDITMSRIFGVTKGLYGLVVGKSGIKIRQELSSA